MSPLYFLVAFIILLPLGLAAASLAPWVPTNPKDLQAIHNAAKLGKGDTFYDLGCGEGQVCRHMAKHNPEATIVGIELALPLYLLARLRQLLHPYTNLRYVCGNALKQDLSDADVVYVYGLIRTVNTKVKPKLLKDLRPGAKAISYHFHMQDWPGTYQKIQTGNAVPLHVYQVAEPR